MIITRYVVYNNQLFMQECDCVLKGNVYTLIQPVHRYPYIDWAAKAWADNPSPIDGNGIRYIYQESVGHLCGLNGEFSDRYPFTKIPESTNVEMYLEGTAEETCLKAEVLYNEFLFQRTMVCTKQTLKWDKENELAQHVF